MRAISEAAYFFDSDRFFPPQEPSGRACGAKRRAPPDLLQSLLETPERSSRQVAVRVGRIVMKF
ncbi:hypothetical protein G6321_00029695 [Bradyrhizobium barranii subsp. barranii]|uniref:Uncharacterized protein n=1 Tax=Bradyrhizobium barranii subsp. barranii TaxID=2823807 RepID=A0A7Z0QJZ9_9BRAD|nr:hypothetical protein [Bradyrhizobium barranii]UGX90025.1 hypothetical protein G6321_00029695 [Bradyrhizobium barranii subsp. barranii]